MRGMSAQGVDDAGLVANTTAAETTNFDYIGGLSATGFTVRNVNDLNNSGTYIYMAIRRPHKPPTAGTEVFAVNTRSGNETVTHSTSGFPVDLSIISSRSDAHWTNVFDRLRGTDRFLATQVSNSEYNYINSLEFDSNTSVIVGTDSQNTQVNRNGQTFVDYLFKRAPGFFDVVTYTGTGSARTVDHNSELYQS